MRDAVGSVGAVHQDSVDDAQHCPPRHAKSESNGAAAFDDVSRLSQRLGTRIVVVVDDGALGLSEDAGLVGDVGLERTVPVEMVLRDVEQRRRVR